MKNVYPSQTGFLHDLYKLDDLPPDFHHHLETGLFKSVDQGAADGLDNFLSDDIDAGFTEKVAIGWAKFLMSLLHRQPPVIANLRRLAHAEFEGTIPKMRAGWGDNPEHENMTFDEYIQANAARMSATLFVNFFVKICTSENIGQHMLNMTKSVATIQDNKRFLTCDNPLTLFRPLDGDGSYILLPINPKKIFIAANNQGIVDRLFERLRDEDLVEQLNQAAISNAYQFVYDTHEDQTGLVKQYFKRAE